MSLLTDTILVSPLMFSKVLKSCPQSLGFCPLLLHPTPAHSMFYRGSPPLAGGWIFWSHRCQWGFPYAAPAIEKPTTGICHLAEPIDPTGMNGWKIPANVRFSEKIIAMFHSVLVKCATMHHPNFKLSK